MTIGYAGIQALLLVNTIVLYVQGICLIIIGCGMYGDGTDW